MQGPLTHTVFCWMHRSIMYQVFPNADLLHTRANRTPDPGTMYDSHEVGMLEDARALWYLALRVLTERLPPIGRLCE